MRGDAGSAAVEFTLVGALLTLLTLSVLQLGLALHVRNTVHDAAAEGARFGALADNAPRDGAARTRELIATSLDPGLVQEVDVAREDWQGHPSLTVTVRATLPVFGLLGLERGLEVSGHAALETLD